MARILIVDDDDAFRESLVETVTGLGHLAEQSSSGQDALAAMRRSRFDAIFLDHRMPGMDGLQTLDAMRAQSSRLPPVIVLTAYADGANTIDAMRLGAFDHLTKPVGRQDVINVLRRALKADEQSRSSATEASCSEDSTDPYRLIGSSPAMREMQKRIGLAAASSAPALLIGETGTGKELVARALHRHSSRADGPFVAINCSAIPKELLESELFGHVRGAFTGAAGERAGCFRAADGGVLLLDEIGDMEPGVQAKILRALQEGEVTPVGSNKSVKVDVRVIAATHRDLSTAVREGQFREDLFYRLNVLPIPVPSLKNRVEDIVPLAEYFLRRAAATNESGAPKTLSAAAAQLLQSQDWPGNVRELRNLMERANALVRHRVIDVSDLLADKNTSGRLTDIDTTQAPDLTSGEMPAAVERLERLMIANALSKSGGNRAEAARILGIHRQLLYKKMSQYGLE